MDIRCRYCGEPWEHDELHYAEPPEELRREYRKAYRRAIPEARREVAWEGQFGSRWLEKPENRTRAIKERAHYMAMGQLFRRFGCQAFGTSCGANQAPPEVGAAQDFSPYPEEWAVE